MSNWTTRIGTDLAGYRIERLIGRGGMSVVYLAEHVRLGKKVALKVMAPSFADDEQFQTRFSRESKLAASLEHPNVVPIYDAGEADGLLYIAMRHIDGPDLGALIEQDGRIPVSRMLYIIEQIAGALDTAHDAGLVHRDVKPANILIDTARDQAYLTDFGIVKHTLTGSSLTKTGLFLGTPHYSSPEQIEGGKVDARTDVYALGGVVYTCLAGSAPYEKEGEVAVMNAHLSDPPPALNLVRPDLPPALGHVISKAMAKDKEDRYQTCLALANDLRSAAMHRPTEEFAAYGGAAAVTPAALEETVLSSSTPAAAAAPLAGPSPAPDPASDAEHAGVGGVTPPPPSESPRRGSPRGGGAWGVPQVAALLVAALVIGFGAAYLAFGGGDSGHAAITTQTVTTTTPGGTGTGAGTGTGTGTTPPPLTADEQRLMSEIPGPVRKFCAVVPPNHAGVVAAASCADKDPNHGLVWVHFHLERNAANLLVDYQHNGADDFKKAAKGDLATFVNVGNCSGVDWLGEGLWTHEKGDMGGSMMKGDGRRLCYQLNDTPCPLAAKLDVHDPPKMCSVIAWTNTASNLFAIAEKPSLIHSQLFGWWRYWLHYIG